MNIEDYWTNPPPKPSNNLNLWITKIEKGWKPNRRIRKLGYYQAALFFKVYIWEYLNILFPKLQ